MKTKAQLQLENRRLKAALEWTVRCLREISLAKGLVAEHGDALDNALMVLDEKPQITKT